MASKLIMIMIKFSNPFARLLRLHVFNKFADPLHPTTSFDTPFAEFLNELFYWVILKRYAA